MSNSKIVKYVEAYYQGTTEPDDDEMMTDDVTAKERKDRDIRPDFVAFKNYDYTNEEANETSPGGGLYHGPMDKFKSVKEFREHKAKHKMPALASRLGSLKKIAEDVIELFPEPSYEDTRSDAEVIQISKLKNITEVPTESTNQNAEIIPIVNKDKMDKEFLELYKKFTTIEREELFNSISNMFFKGTLEKKFGDLPITGNGPIEAGAYYTLKKLSDVLNFPQSQRRVTRKEKREYGLGVLDNMVGIRPNKPDRPIGVDYDREEIFDEIYRLEHEYSILEILYLAKSLFYNSISQNFYCESCGNNFFLSHNTNCKLCEDRWER